MDEAIKENGSNGRKKKIAIIALAVLLISAAVAVFYYLSYKAVHISTDDAFVDGRIYAVAPKIAGTIKAVHVTDNQTVKKGDLLIEIEPADYAARVSEAMSSADAEKAKLSEARVSVGAARAQLELREANLRQAELDVRRADGLYAKGAISKERHEKTRTGFEVMAAEVKASREMLHQTESSILTQSSKVMAGQARLKAEQLNIGYTNIYAPSDGIITKKSVEKGNQVQPGQPIMAVVALDDIWITANYKETQLKKIKPGQKVEIKADSYSGETLHGKVDSIMAGTGAVFSLFPPENATGNYVKIVQRIPVKIVLDKGTDPRRVLRVGMSVVPTVIAE